MRYIELSSAANNLSAQLGRQSSGEGNEFRATGNDPEMCVFFIWDFQSQELTAMISQLRGNRIIFKT